MKATLETITGIQMNIDIDISDTPMTIVRKFYEDDITAATQFFTYQIIIDQIMDGYVYEDMAFFDLISVEGDNIRADWKTSLCNQPAIKEEIARIESKGQVPTFVVHVKGFAT